MRKGQRKFAVDAQPILCTCGHYEIVYGDTRPCPKTQDHPCCWCSGESPDPENGITTATLEIWGSKWVEAAVEVLHGPYQGLPTGVLGMSETYSSPSTEPAT